MGKPNANADAIAHKDFEFGLFDVIIVRSEDLLSMGRTPSRLYFNCLLPALDDEDNLHVFWPILQPAVG